MLRSAPARAVVLVSVTAAALVTARCSNESALDVAGSRSAAVRAPAPAFTITPLLRPDGSSEPAITIGRDGTMALSGLSWNEFFTNVWKGPFGSTPAFQGQIDAHIGKSVGGGDADIDIGSTGTLHATTLVFFFNPQVNALQLGVSAITCPNADTSGNFANCKAQILDQTQSDRQWITSDGARVYVAYHDSGNSTLVHVQRSDDDGFTFKRVADPIVGQGNATGGSTFNNENGPIVADPVSHNVYDIYAAGEPGIQKATSTDFNHVYVSKSTDAGKSWTATQVFAAPQFTSLNNIFPSLAVDPADGTLYAVWSDASTVALSKSTDQGATWSAAKTVSFAPNNTAVFPWVAARNGTVDVVFYGTTAASKDDPSAAWNVYLSQSTDKGAHFAQVQVTQKPNHVGVICTNGTGCARGTRNLLDLFEVAIDPRSGKAGIIYTDDTLTTEPDGAPLPQVVLATQN
jgi:hypothetical protein